MYKIIKKLFWEYFTAIKELFSLFIIIISFQKIVTYSKNMNI